MTNRAYQARSSGHHSGDSGNADGGTGDAFADTESLAAEPAACAVRDAVNRGTLAAERLESYRKLDRELAPS